MKIISAILATTLCGCASIVSKAEYPVTLDSNPSGAHLVVRDDRGKTVFEGTAPTTMNLKASEGFFQSASYSVEASMAGHDPVSTTISSNMDPWYIGNILFGGLIGFIIVDPATGAMWRLDKEVVVHLDGGPGKETDEGPPAP